MIEKEAIAHLKQGNITGLKILVRLYQLKAVRTACFITRDLTLAEDVVQDAFLQIYERINQFDDSRLFEPWLISIVINRSLTVVKQNKKSISLETLNPDTAISLLESLPDIAPGPDEEASRKMLREKVREALEKLAPEQRAAIILRYYLDMSEVEVSNQQEVALGTIKWRLHTARKQLRFLLSVKEII